MQIDIAMLTHAQDDSYERGALSFEERVVFCVDRAAGILPENAATLNSKGLLYMYTTSTKRIIVEKPPRAPESSALYSRPGAQLCTPPAPMRSDRKKLRMRRSSYGAPSTYILSPCCYTVTSSYSKGNIYIHELEGTRTA